MNPEQWQRVKAVLAEALELPPLQREGWIAARLGDEPGLAAEVASLLAAHDAGGEVLEPPPSPFEPPPPAAIEAGAGIGVWRVVRELGRGGMGVVYLAERDDDSFERRVAIKLIHHGNVDADSERRFLAERRILARLDHPGIARLLDGGTTPSGHPYLVMEYVEGQPIDVYCGTLGLGLHARVALFLAICEAVEFAHRNLVVHRDLKPSNVLVDGDGTPKLLDFGIAKLLDDELGGTARVTATGLRAMTPEYASPEQIRGDPIATTSDVYSLGVMLYELLCGRRPYELHDRGLSEVVRAVCDIDPPAPSVAAQASAAGTPAPPRELHGDLDAIVLKALRNEPAGRYQSAAQLAADLQCWRDGRPVAARRGSLAYRAAKLARRHRLAVAFAAGIVVLLTAFAVSMTLQVASTRRALARAEAEAAKATAVQQFLEQTLNAADPQDSEGHQVTIQEALDDARARLATAFENQPGIAAAVQQLIGSLYSNMGRYDDAEPLLRTALATRRRLELTPAEEIAENLESLAVLLGRSGRAGEAEPLLREALELRRRPGASPGPEIGKDLDLLAHVANAGGDARRAAGLERKALAAYRETLGERNPSVAHALTAVAGFERAAGELDAAEAALRDAVEILSSLPEPPLLTRAELEMDLGELLEARGRYPESEQHYRAGLATFRRLYGDEHHWVAQALVRLGTVLTREGRFDQAESALRAGVAMMRRVLDPGHPDIATSLNNLAFLLAERGDLDEAATNLEAVLTMQRAAIPGHPFIATTLRSLGTLELRRGHPAVARRELEEALTIDRDSYGDGHPNTARSALALGWAVGELGDWQHAESLQRAALAELETSLGSDHPRVAEARALYARSVAELGRRDAAAALLEQALPVLRKAHPPDNYRIRHAEATLAALSRPAG